MTFFHVHVGIHFVFVLSDVSNMWDQEIGNILRNDTFSVIAAIARVKMVKR